MKTLLGKALRERKNNWTVVPGTTKGLTAKALTNITEIRVFNSEFSDDVYCSINTADNKFVNFTVDRQAHLQAGDLIDPKSVRVYDLTNGEKTITRLYGKAL